MHKKQMHAPRHLLLLLAGASLTLPAIATEGTFPHGYGVKAEGMGGVGIALPQDAVTGATNPSGMVMVGSRLDLGGALLQVDNGAHSAGVDYSGSKDKSLYVIPQLGYNQMLGNDASIGISVIGNGVGAAYGNANVGGMSNPKTELKQMVSTVSYARKLNADHAIGVGLVLAYQRLAINGPAGLGLPEGTDSAFGTGISLGWTGKVAPNVTLGATYASRVFMGKMDKFKGLLAEGGDLDIPEHYGLGVAVNLGKTTLAGDVLRINWGDVKSLGNAGVAVAPGAAGTDSGPGFGWRNQTVWRIGASHPFSEQLTLRAGYSQGDQILNSRDTFLGILAPAANRKHLTLGGTWQLSKTSEVSFAYAHSLKETVNGNGPGPNASTDLYMGQNWLSASYGMSF